LKEKNQLGEKASRAVESVNYMALVTEIGLIMPSNLIAGFFLGLYLDRWLGTAHTFLFLFTILGVLSGAKLSYSRIKKIGK